MMEATAQDIPATPSAQLPIDEPRGSSWIVSLQPLVWPLLGYINAKAEKGWEQELTLSEIDSNSLADRDPRDGVPWSGQRLGFDEIYLRYEINWKSPLGYGAYGKIVEVRAPVFGELITGIGYRSGNERGTASYI
jgi:hypothetical protein